MKGHVDPGRMLEYRYWKDRAREAESLGSVLSGLGEYDLANAMWKAERIICNRANECRVDIEPKDDHEDSGD